MSNWAKPAWMVWAEKELGTAEIPGPKDNPRVIEYWRIAGLDRENPAHNELTSWCGAFIAACFASVKVTPWGDASARSWGRPGSAVRLPRPVYGSIGVKMRTGGLVWQGHVGIVAAVSPDGKHVTLLAGNQGDKVSYAWFNAQDFAGADNLGFFWPKTVTLPVVQDAPRIVPGNIAAVKEA